MRLARPADRDALLELWREVDDLHAELQPGFFRLEHDRSTTLGERLRESQSGGWQALFVAARRDDAGADDEEVVGLLWARIFDTPAAPLFVQRRRVHVEDLVVARAHRRGGCGRALLTAASSWARQKGAGQLLLTVWSGNREAEAFYQALGYRPISQVLGTEL